MNDKKLAILGGTPIRTRPFQSLPLVDDRELNAVKRSIIEGYFSRFVGSPLPGTREQLRMTSQELEHLTDQVSFLGGPNVRRFEAAWAEAHGVPYAVAMNSATSGLTAALMAMNVGPGCEVITTPLSFTATATAIVAANAVPVFADIDADTFCLDPAAVEAAITSRTKCIVPVHWCGNAGHFDRIMEIARKHDFPVLEDAAQAPGTEYQGRFLGSIGHAGVFSFSEPKNVMTGEGGMVITSDPSIAEKCRLIRNHGEVVPNDDDSDDYVVNTVGYNFRMVELTAAIGWVQTSKLDRANEIRKRNHQYLVSRLLDVTEEFLRPQRLTHSDTFYAYTAAFRWFETNSGLSRNTVAAALRAEGIPVATGVGRLLADHPLFRRKLAFGPGGYPFRMNGEEIGRSYAPNDLPHARCLHENEYLGFFLMGWPNKESDMDDIVAAFRKIVEGRKSLSEYAAIHLKGPLPFNRGRS